jgi:hypothetical protein
VADAGELPLPVVDGRTLPAELRAVLRPGEGLVDRAGRRRRLPRWFYRVESWELALQVKLAPNFALWEFLSVDLREAPQQQTFPRYVPCAVTALAAHLEVFRRAVANVVHIAANGGYRSPGHALTTHASLHCWGTAANIYRIGDQYLDTRERIQRFAAQARDVLPAVWVRPYGEAVGEADDHLHLDAGYLTLVPRDPGPAGDDDPDARDAANH